MEDPRNESYITYTQADFIYMGVLKNICSAESMRQMEEKYNVATVGNVTEDAIKKYIREQSEESRRERS